VVLAYSWRSMVCSMGKEHGQNRGPTIFSWILNGPINQGDNFVPFPNRMVLLLGLIRMKTLSPTL
jgi:hypothetical protein